MKVKVWKNDLQVAVVDLYEMKIECSVDDGDGRDDPRNGDNVVAVVAGAENDGADGLDQASTHGKLLHGADVRRSQHGKWRGDCLIGLAPLQQLQPHGKD